MRLTLSLSLARSFSRRDALEAKVEARSVAQDGPAEIGRALPAGIEAPTLRMRFRQDSGGYVGGVTPVPIPNTEVKPSRADGTSRETARESRSLPDTFTEGLGLPLYRARSGAFAFAGEAQAIAEVLRRGRV